MALFSIADFSAEMRIIVKVIHYSFPVLALLYFLIASTIAFCAQNTTKGQHKEENIGKKFILSWLSVIALVYVRHQLI